jgi:hypothetical protein
MNAGYNQVGEANNIIILYPQAISVSVNPYGCWDWWGYTVSFYGKILFKGELQKRLVNLY